MWTKITNLIARLNELFDSLQKLNIDVSSKYQHGASGTSVPADNDAAEELRPYRALNADRLKIVGRGQWDCAEFIEDLLYMPFLEPKFNQFDIVPSADSVPDVTREDPRELIKLARVWDKQNLLRLIPSELLPCEPCFFARIFNNINPRIGIGR